MSFYPIPNYTYNTSTSLDVNLENLVLFYKYQLLRAYVSIKPMTIEEHNSLIGLIGDVIHNFKDDISTFSEITDVEIRWQWIGKIKAEETLILEKSIVIVNKLRLP